MVKLKRPTGRVYTIRVHVKGEVIGMARILACLLFLISLPHIWGQTLGTITGEVTDATGAVVPAAAVTVRNTGTNAVREAVTNAEGLYSVPSLQPGVYDVHVEKAGFRGATRSTIELQVQQTAR